MTIVAMVTTFTWIGAVLVLLVRRRPVTAGIAAGSVGAAWLGSVAGVSGAAMVLVLTIAIVGIGALLARSSRSTNELGRARLQWVAWGAVVATTVAVGAAALDALLGWPEHPDAVALAATTAIPVALILSSFDGPTAWIGPVLVHTIVGVGLTGLVGATYLLVVIGLGRTPQDSERSVLALSMGAAAIAAIAAVPARHRLVEFANERVFGGRVTPDEALRTFGGRMSRAVPMDELLLQLTESLRETMHLSAAEVWTGADGALERAVSVPDRPPASIVLAGEELSVAARSHVQGNAWMQVWMPALLAGRTEHTLRVAVVAHLGEVLGLIVVERPPDGAAFTEEEDRVLTELARQVGLALHNVRLDSALQASLDELQERNEELAASRLRIVTASDESRRRIERDLHDGAQQHLVALAVKVGLVKQLLEADPETARQFLDELREDVQATLTELRDLAHGIYPPLLRDRGLPEALRTAANRAPLPTEVVASGIARHSPEVDAAIYFCCLEAMQNAGKYAGDAAHVIVTVTEDTGHLRFEVGDNGPGFVAASQAEGHGFVNMRDRLGAVGGTLDVRSAPGEGTAVVGEVPIPGVPAVAGPEAGRAAAPADS